MFIVEIAGYDHAPSKHYDAYSWSSSAFFAVGSPFCLAKSALASATRSLNCSPASEATSASESYKYIPPLISSLAKGRNADPIPERISVIGVSPLRETRFDPLRSGADSHSLHRSHRTQSAFLPVLWLSLRKPFPFHTLRRGSTHQYLYGFRIYGLDAPPNTALSRLTYASRFSLALAPPSKVNSIPPSLLLPDR